MLEWKKVTAIVLWTLITFINLYRNSKNFILKSNILTVRQMFRKEKLYDLTTVSSWSENNYHLFGLKTGREIIINTENGLRLKLSDSNLREFEKLSEYLDGNVSQTNV